VERFHRVVGFSQSSTFAIEPDIRSVLATQNGTVLCVER